MDRLTKLLLAAIGLAAIQTVNAAFISQSGIAAASAIFCWAVVVVVGRRWSVR